MTFRGIWQASIDFLNKKYYYNQLKLFSNYSRSNVVTIYKRNRIYATLFSIGALILAIAGKVVLCCLFVIVAMMFLSIKR